MGSDVRRVCAVGLLLLGAWRGTPSASGLLPGVMEFGAGGAGRAMGAHIAVAEDSAAANWNPAGLRRLRSREFLFQMSGSALGGVNLFYGAYGNPLSEADAFAVSLAYLGIGGLESYDAMGGRRGAFGIRQYLLTAGYGRSLGPRVSVGGALKFLGQSIEDASANTVDLDAGLLWRPLGWLSAGLAVRNVLPLSYRFLGGGREDLPADVGLGLKTEFWKGRLVVAMDGAATVARRLVPRWSGGMSYRVGESLVLMGGLDHAWRFSGGVGAEMRDVRLHSGVMMNPVGGLDFQVALAYRLKDVFAETGRELDFFYKGTVFYNNRDYRNAIKYFEKVLEIREDPTARFYLEASRRYLASGAALSDEERELVRFNLERARKAAAEGDPGTAVSAYREVLTIQPGHKEATEEMERLKERVEPEVRGHYNEGMALFRARKYREALEKSKFALALNPEHGPSLELKAKAEAVLKDIIEAEQKEEQKRIEARALYDEGLARYREERWTEAVSMFQKSLDLDPTMTNARLYLEKARQNLRVSRSVQERRKDAERFFQNGLAAYQDKRLREALDEFEKALAANPEHREAAEYLRKVREEYEATVSAPLEEGKTALRENRLGDAIAAFERVLRIDPEHAVGKEFLARARGMVKDAIVRYNAQGERLLKEGKFEEALKEFRQVLLLDPANSQAQAGIKTCRERLKEMVDRYMDAGVGQLNAQEYRRAMETFERVLAIDPEYQPAKDYLERARQGFERNRTAELQKEHLRKANEAFVNRDFGTAKRLFQQVLAVSPDGPLAAEAREGIRRCDEQMATMEREGRIAEKFKEGVMAFKAQRYEDAIAIWSSIKELDPQNRLVDDYITYAKTAQQQRGNRSLAEGQEALRKGDLLAAREAARRALEIDPLNPKARELSSRVNTQIIKAVQDERRKADDAFRAGRYEEAAAAYGTILRYEPENDEVTERQALSRSVAEWRRSGSAALERREFADANDWFRQVLAVNPDDGVAAEGVRRAQEEGRRFAQQWFAEAEQLVAQGQLRKAASRLSAVVAATKDAKAEARLRDVERMIEDAAREAYARAVEHQNQGRHRQAVQEFDRVLDLKNPYKDALALRERSSRELQKQGERESAERRAKAQQHMLAGQQYYRDEKLREAIAEWEEVLKLFPDDEQAKKYIARARYRLQAGGGR